MAYIETRKRKNGVAYVVEFRRFGKVYKLSLDRTYNIKDARFIAAAIDAAIAAEKKGAGLDAQTRKIFEHLAPDMRRRLERAGLLAIAQTTTLREAVELFERDYFPALGERTRAGYSRTLENFTDFIANDARPVDSIADDEASRFVKLLKSVYAENTVKLRVARLKTFFKFLESKKIIDISPFADVATGALVAGRRNYVGRETVERIAATLDDERRALLYLYRYAGLRRSEPYLLTYKNIDVKRKRLYIPTPKTARFAGRGERVAPIFPELASALSRITGERTDKTIVFTKRLNEKILKKFLPPGVRAFQDLRVSCENDWLEQRFPPHVVAAWIGHQTNVQARHYAVVLDAYFEAATQGNSPGKIVGENVGDF